MIRTAFVPGAGLGKRLRPLTADRPKPLVPVFNRPLITLVFDALIEVGIERFVVNTHHCAEAYGRLMGDRYRGCEVRYVHEPVLLETGGGLRNARAHFGEEPVLVHNGDVVASLNLRGLLARHAEADAEVTALLRGRDGPLQVRFDSETRRVTDFRGALGGPGVDTLFTGAYVVTPKFLDRIPADEIVSVVPIFLEMLREGAPIAGVLDDSGMWADLGNRASYLAAHAGRTVVDSSAEIAQSVELRGSVTIGAGARIGEDAELKDCVVWENAEIASGSRLTACIVRDGRQVSGTHADMDF